jgi:hypothetical protein
VGVQRLTEFDDRRRSNAIGPNWRRILRWGAAQVGGAHRLRNQTNDLEVGRCDDQGSLRE